MLSNLTNRSDLPRNNKPSVKRPQGHSGGRLGVTDHRLGLFSLFDVSLAMEPEMRSYFSGVHLLHSALPPKASPSSQLGAQRQILHPKLPVGWRRLEEPSAFGDYGGKQEPCPGIRAGPRLSRLCCRVSVLPAQLQLCSELPAQGFHPRHFLPLNHQAGLQQNPEPSTRQSHVAPSGIYIN